MKEINYGYDDILVFDHDRTPRLGQPPFINLSAENPNLLPQDSPFHSRTKEEVEEILKCKFPLITNHPPGILYNSIRTPPGFNVSTRVDTVDAFVEKNTQFIYPVQIFSNDFFSSEPPLLPSNVLTASKNGLCKVVFFYGTEGHPFSLEIFYWLYEFSKMNDLSSSNFILFSGNLLLDKYLTGFELLTGHRDFITVGEDYYFENCLWFLVPSGDTTQSRIRVDMWNHLELKMSSIRNRDIKNHFLCFNRRNHVHRIVLAAHILSSDSLRDTTILSLGREFYGQEELKRDYILSNFSSDRDNIKFTATVKNLDFNKDIHVDIDSAINAANNLNIQLHEQTFVNIVTETLIDPRSLFFSEKIFKPIYMLQPFVLLGNPGSISKLKEMGYKTFDQWWDEGYDKEVDLNKRINLIVKVLEEIATWSFTEVKSVLQEMEPLLHHNFTRLLDRQRYTEFTRILTS